MIGRNDPCQCGSGRKFKHCCLRAPDSGHLVVQRLREAEGRLIPLMWHIALSTWKQEGLEEAYDTFFMDTPLPGDIQTHPEHESLFLTWLALRFAPAPRRVARPSSAALRLLSEGHELSERERQFVKAAESASPAFYAVVSAEAGASIDLEDILTGSAWHVIEGTASRTVRPGGVLYARVVTVENVSIMVGCGAALLPPTRRSDVADLREHIGSRGRRPTAGDLRTFEDMLRRWYLLAADQERNPPPPRFTNTDGDPLAPTTLTFTLRCTPAEAFDALRTLSVTDSDEAALLANAERDAGGHLLAFSLDWTKRGNRVNKSWENTILGHLEVRGQTLSATVNSSRRATRLRKQIDKRLGNRVSLERTVIESVDALLAKARTGPSEPVPDSSPEMVAEFEAQHWQTWVDQPIPALKGQTPREAAATPRGRERLQALLVEFEWRGGVPVEQLRAQLGLE